MYLQLQHPIQYQVKPLFKILVMTLIQILVKLWKKQSENPDPVIHFLKTNPSSQEKE